MSIADRYINYVNQEVKQEPDKGWSRMILGFQANKWRTRLLPKKNLSKGYQKLESLMMSLVAESLGREDRYVWGNIFAPCEIMECFGLNTLSIECLSCYFSGYHLEDYFIDSAQNSGIHHAIFIHHASAGNRLPVHNLLHRRKCFTAIDGNIRVQPWHIREHKFIQ